MTESNWLVPVETKNITQLVPAEFRKLVEKLYTEHPEYAEMNEHQLTKILQPDEYVDMVRLSFWAEYESAQIQNRKMKLVHVWKGVVSQAAFFAMIKKPHALAWIMTPVSEHLSPIKAALEKGRHTVARILRMDVFDDHGNLKIPEAAHFLKAYKLAEDRVLGQSVQRTISKINVALETATQETVEAIAAKVNDDEADEG